jgi:hypothetical protein
MNKTNNEFEIVIKNKKIWNFYNDNKNIDIETANLFFIDFFENIFNHSTKNMDKNINAQILNYMNENQKQIDSIKSNLSTMNESVTKLNNEFTNNMMLQFMNLKKEYIDDVKQIITNSSLTTNDKISSLIDKNNNHIIDKTTLLINDIMPKNMENVNKQMQSTIKNFYSLIMEETKTLSKENSNEKSFNEFISKLDTKYSTMLQSIQQPLFSFFTASENRINNNIDLLKESSYNSTLTQNKLSVELTEFLGKYKNSSNKGKYGEHNLCNLLNSIYQNAEIKDTTSLKSSGDFIMKRLDKPTILFENKEYDRNIDRDEIAKFIRDIEMQNVSGVFISQFSGITFKENFQIDINKGNVLMYIQNCDYSSDKVKLAVDIIDNLYSKIQDLNVDDENNTISKDILDSINDEYQCCISQKETMMTILKDFNKKMSSQIEDIKFPELDKYLSQKYAYVKTRCFTCDICNNFTAGSKQSLSAHKRGCSKKYNNSNVMNNK